MPSAYDLAPEVGQGFQSCGSALGCLEVATASLLVVLVWAGFSTFMLFSPQVNVRDAVAALRSEYARVEDERTAFAAFSDRLETIPAAHPMAAQVNTVGTTMSANTGGEMAHVLCAYEETVMAVDHYEEDYGEPLAQHLAVEFGENVAGAVTTNDSVSPQLKQALIANSQDSRAQRQQYLNSLERERRQLTRAGESFESLADVCADVDGDRLRRRPFDELQDRLGRLAAAQHRLRDVLQERQQQLHQGVKFGWERRDAESVYRYLYQELDVTYPVLADGTRLAERMREVEHKLVTALTART